jgi:hypothetical protein
MHDLLNTSNNNMVCDPIFMVGVVKFDEIYGIMTVHYGDKLITQRKVYKWKDANKDTGIVILYH